MIPTAYIREWYELAPWQTWAMVEQDLLISRMLVELFASDFLSKKLIFRGGTALHKLFFARPMRYSEDIDLVQHKCEPIGPIFDEIRSIFDPLIGEPRRRQGPDIAHLTYRFESEDSPPTPLRIKIEINTREHLIFQPLEHKNLAIENRWFSGESKIPVYQPAEMLATKMRALYQRRKGRDLFDLAMALQEFNIPPEKIVDLFKKYMEAEGNQVGQSDYRENILQKMQHPGFKDDCTPLLHPETEFDVEEAFELFDTMIISQI